MNRRNEMRCEKNPLKHCWFIIIFCIMPRRKQPVRLLNSALRRLIELLVCYSHECKVDSASFPILQKYVSCIPPNLWDQWAEELLSTLDKSKISSDLQYLIFGKALTGINLDDFPTLLPVNCQTFCNFFPVSTNLKSLCSRYAPYFWTTSQLSLFQNSAVHLKNLQYVTLCNLDLRESPHFLETIGSHCQKIKELDISHSRIPVSQCQVISKNFPNLEVLKIKQKSEKSQNFSIDETVQILTSLCKLRIFDDDSNVWSSILPALSHLSQEKYSCQCAFIEYLTVYKIFEVDKRFVQFVRRICIDSKVLLQANSYSIIRWLEKFQALESIDLRLQNITPPVLEALLRDRIVGSRIHSLHLSRSSFSFQSVYTIGCSAPNLKNLEIINSSPFDSCSSSNSDTSPRPSCFQKLEFLSYTGAWDEKLASLLLDDCIDMKVLHLKAHTLPIQFLKRNPLARLERLVLDLSLIIWNAPIFHVYNIELDFIRRIIKSATALREIHLKNRPSKEWELLRQHLRVENLDLEILCPL